MKCLSVDARIYSTSPSLGVGGGGGGYRETGEEQKRGGGGGGQAEAGFFVSCSQNW